MREQDHTRPPGASWHASTAPPGGPAGKGLTWQPVLMSKEGGVCLSQASTGGGISLLIKYLPQPSREGPACSPGQRECWLRARGARKRGPHPPYHACQAHLPTCHLASEGPRGSSGDRGHPAMTEYLFRVSQWEGGSHTLLSHHGSVCGCRHTRDHGDHRDRPLTAPGCLPSVPTHRRTSAAPRSWRAAALSPTPQRRGML